MRQIIKRLIISLLILLLLIIVGGGGWVYWRARASLAQLEGAIQVAGLSAPVEVLRDARGVPHLRASSLQDLFFAQGYVTAQDRLWQMDLSRRLAEGELSEVFGERTLRLDLDNRTLGFRQVSQRALAELSPEARAPLTAYANGVNAFIASHRDRLSLEFHLLHYQPRPWTEADSLGVALNMAKSLNTTWGTDLMRERIKAKLSSELFADLFPDHSPLDEPVAELAATPGRMPKRTSSPSADGSFRGVPQTRDDEGSRTSVPFRARFLASLGMTTDPGDLDPTLAALLSAGDNSDAGLGSNNWVVSGAHTQSGKPLLANDPHLDHSVPSVWYMIHLKGPGLNVIGVSLPGLPLVIIGHNEKIAWGMTNTGPDVQDLYTESFDSGARNRYLHNGAWVDAEVRDEVVKVRGKRDYRLTVKVTRHGPIVAHPGGRDLALRWTALEPHALSALFNGVSKIILAQNWELFTAALHDYTGPMQNFVYADMDGNIGYYAAAWVPIRKQGTGAVPVPGSTDDYDWTGYIPFEDLPHSYNPPSGLIATANGRVVPDDYPYFITSHWDPPFRTARIFQLLRAGKALGVDDMLRIQTDIVTLEDSWLAGQLLKADFHYHPQDPDAQYAISLLRRWDGEARMDSAATLVCEVTRPALLERILKPKLGDDLSGYRWGMSTTFLANVLANNWTRWLPRGDSSFEETLIKSLEEGVKQIPSLVGSRSHEAWKWGNTIPLTFYHPLGQGFPLLGRLLDVGPFPQTGTASTVKATTSRHGPSMRMVVDLSTLDHSVQNITLGESGQVFSPYYQDQFEAWYNGRSFPMSFSDAAVEQATVHKLVLRPDSGQ
ncbi:MAG: penicillin acylase family protein [Terriglobia bacterium]|jgi:penicillin amidase